MLKFLTATFLATAALTGAAQASKMDDYQTCWSTEATTILNKEGVTEDTLKKAVGWADSLCRSQQIDALLETSVEDQKAMREYMEVQLYNANPVAEETQVAAIPEPEKKIEKISGFTPRVGYNLYNARTGFLCQFPGDVENARGLVDTNREHLVEQIGGCVVFDKPIEVEKVRTLYSAIEVRYVTDQGKLVTAYTSERTFRTQRDWHRIGIE